MKPCHMHKAIFLVFFVIASKSQWISSSVKIGKHDASMAVGYYDGIITLLGGLYESYDIIEYDISQDAFTTLSQKLSGSSYGRSQWFVQGHNTIYMVYSAGDYISTYNLITKQFTLAPIQIPTDVSDYGCLAHSYTEEKLYVIGGWDTANDADMNDLQVYNLNTYNWETGPGMQQTRYMHACIVSPTNHKLYAIAGAYWDYDEGDEVRISSIEYIPTNGIISNSWQYTNNPLFIGLRGARAVIHQELIFVIGGQDSNSEIGTNIEIIDTNTDTVSFSVDEAQYGALHVAPIIVDDRLYSFGGIDGDPMDIFQYYDLPTITTTKAPTKYPTKAPTKSPTKAPTKSSTKAPTKSPTKALTELPSKSPVKVSTKVPTNAPTKGPTKQPTTGVTATVPTLKPTVMRTNTESESDDDDGGDTNTEEPVAASANTMSDVMLIVVITIILFGIVFCLVCIIWRIMKESNDKSIHNMINEGMHQGNVHNNGNNNALIGDIDLIQYNMNQPPNDGGINDEMVDDIDAMRVATEPIEDDIDEEILDDVNSYATPNSNAMYRGNDIHSLNILPEGARVHAVGADEYYDEGLANKEKTAETDGNIVAGDFEVIGDDEVIQGTESTRY